MLVDRYFGFQEVQGVYRKFMEILKVISDDKLDQEERFDDIIRRLEMSDVNLLRVNDELRAIEKARLMGEEDLDTIRSVLVYLFMKKSTLDTEEVYALVYGDGNRVTWH